MTPAGVENEGGASRSRRHRTTNKESSGISYQKICLICNSSNSDMTPETISSFSSGLPPLLSKDLNVYFILKHVLQLPFELLEKYLKEHSSLGELFIICKPCGENIVEKCAKIFLEMLEVKRRFSVARWELIQVMKMTNQTDADASKEHSGPQQFQNLKLYEEIRHVIRQYEPQSEINPFIGGDIRAREQLASQHHRGRKTKALNPTSPSISMSTAGKGQSRMQKLKQEMKNNGQNANPNEEPLPTAHISSDLHCEEISPTNEEADDNFEEDDWTPEHLSHSSSEDEEDEYDEYEHSYDKSPTHGKSSFTERSRLLRHSCDSCSLKFRTKLILKRHQIRVHGTNLFECDKCDWKNKNKTHFKNHMKRYHGSEQDLEEITCSFCQKVMASKKSLKQHISAFHSEERETFKCDHCERTFLLKETYLNHMSTEHGEKDKQRYTCSFEGCGKSFYSRSRLTQHEALHKPPEFKCDICGKEFYMRIRLKAHIKHLHENDGKRPFKCDLCPSSFPRKHSLNAHIKTIHDVTQPKKQSRKPRIMFKCSECDGEFALEKQLKSHMETMHGKIYESPEPKCSICGATFAQKSLLVSHIERVHERKYEVCCELCGIVISNKQYLKKHKRIVHGIGDYEIPRFPCTVEGCTKSFGTRCNLQTHILYRHEGQRKFQCEQCGKSVVNRNHLRRHIQAVHLNSESKPFKCEECGQRFAINEYLLQHQRNHHQQ